MTLGEQPNHGGKKAFDEIVAGSGLGELGRGELPTQRLKVRVTQETIVAFNSVKKRDGVSITESIRRVLAVGIATNDLSESQTTVVERNRLTGEERPFLTETTLNNTTRDSQIEVLEPDDPLTMFGFVDTAVTGQMVAAIRLFQERYDCTEEQAFNALIRRGSMTISAMLAPDTLLVIKGSDRERFLRYMPSGEEQQRGLSIFDVIADHIRTKEEPYDVEAGLDRLRAWMSGKRNKWKRSPTDKGEGPDDVDPPSEDTPQPPQV